MFGRKFGTPVFYSSGNVGMAVKKLEQLFLRNLNKSALDESVQPVQMARSVFDPPAPTPACPVAVLHGLMGSRVNWNSVARSLSATAHRKPELVEKLVVVDISPVRISSSLHQTRQYLEAMISMTMDPDLPLSRARKLADEQLSKVVPDVGMRQFLLMNLVHGDEGKSCRWRVNLESLLHNFDYVTNFPSINCTYNGPTLFVAGELSDYVRPEDESSILSIFPSAKFEYVSGAGHLVHIEKPQEFVRIVTQFLFGT